jgi:hypothetical protein
MKNGSQKRALKNYRIRLNDRGMARFEVLGLRTDRELIRSIARQLAVGGTDATRMRATLQSATSSESMSKGRILDALRRSPLVGADLDLTRPTMDGRKVEL